jgi:hypothetical protein
LPVGSWVRDVGPVRYVMAFKNGHLTVTATMTSENGEETVTHGMVLTADCYPTRDGSGLVGLVTSVDLTLDGPSMVDVADTLTDDLPKLQKILADQPLAMSFRVQDDVLVIGNVRLPSAGDNEMLEALAMGGRYKLSNGPLPKQKAAKAKAASGVVVGPVLGAGVGLSVGAATGNPKCGAVVGGMTLPSPRYLEHYPQYFSPDPNSPLPRELNSQVPAGQVERIGIDFSVNPPVVVAAPVVPASVPVVLPPAPAAKKPNPFRNGGVSDANARMQELLNDSEDLRHVGQEWRQFWFKDQPFIPPAAK